MASLSKAAGRNAAYIHQFLTRNVPLELPEAVRETLGAYLNVPADALREGSKAAPMTARPASNVRLAPGFALPARQSMNRDVPVFGTAQGGPDGVFHLNLEGGPIDWARRPPALDNIESAFAIFVEGDSMVPWRQPGEVSYINPKRSPRIGDHIVVELAGAGPGDPPAAIVKRLVRRTATKWVLAQYNPAMEIEVSVEDVSRVFRVMEWAELFGA